MIIYIDNDFLCHTKSAPGLREIETDFFDGRCKMFIEGYRFIPSGEMWTDGNGFTFEGEMASPAVNYAILEAVQAQYEADQAQAADMQEALNILGVTE